MKSTLNVALSGIVTSDEMSALANAITFTNSSPNPPSGSRRITFTVTDFEGDVISDGINVTVSGPPPTLPPTILNLDTAITVDAGAVAAGIVLDSDLSIDNPDATGFAGGSLVVSLASATIDDALSVADIGGITVVSGTVFYLGVPIGTISGGTAGTPISIALSGTVTTTEISALANAITLTNGSATPPTTPRTVTYTVTDTWCDWGDPSNFTLTITPLGEDSLIIGNFAAVESISSKLAHRNDCVCS